MLRGMCSSINGTNSMRWFLIGVRLAFIAAWFAAVAVAKANETTPAPAANPEVRSPAESAATPLVPQGIEALTARVQPSIVVIRFAGRDGTPQGVGSGFVIREDGLIATNLHVIGEARPVTVQLFDGRKFPVTAIHAHDRAHDLAILKIDAAGLPALPLAPADALVQGQPIVAFGNPQGLAHSVVTGIVSALREEIDGQPMIQLAIPIEQGNSGGPAVDLEGRVHGLLTLKSIVTDNLGYAVVADALRPLLEEPNPIPMERWLTIGVLNPKYWQAAENGVRWTQRAGHIRAEGTGSEFGGRSLCLSTREVPAGPFEVAVTVKMKEEDGAAGLVFHSDGGDRHYGFYPSSGQLRFSRFDGATVYAWHVLREARSAHFRPGDWNRIRVRVDAGKFQCYCNDELVFEVADERYTSGKVGLAKFRHTTAEFKAFAMGAELPTHRVDPEIAARVTELVDEIATDRPPRSTLVHDVEQTGLAGRRALDQRADELERQVQRLRELSRAVHAQHVRGEIVRVLRSEDGGAGDLLRAALLLASLDNDELDVDFYVQVVQDLADEFQRTLPEGISAADRLSAFHRFLFEEQGFHGARMSYYTASNSYLNEVLDDREGLPITLSVVYVELAKRVGIEAAGIGLPGHFVAQATVDGRSQLIDVFDRGRSMTQAEAMAQVVARGLEWQESYLQPQPPEAIIVRMLRNLIQVANDAGDAEAALRYTDVILALQPDSVEDRLFRAVLCYNTRRAEEGLVEVDWILERRPEGLVMERVEQLRGALEGLK